MNQLKLMGHANMVSRPIRFSSTEAEQPASPALGRIRRPRKLKVEYLAGDSFPIDRHGVLPLPEQANRRLVAQFFKHRRLTNDLLIEFLEEKFLKFVSAALQQDEATVRANAEHNFADRVVSNFAQIKESGLKFEPGSGQLDNLIKADTADYGMLRSNLISDIDQTYIVDNLLVQGVSARRSENQSNFDYRLRKQEEEQGLRQYVHKYFEGYGLYYQLKA